MADTIALMRKRVLDMAIRGELVNQLPEEDSADTLIGEIILEKKRRKKGVNISVVTDEEKPFDLPKNWRWIKFGDLVHFQIGKTPARGNKIFWDNGVYPWVSIADMNNGEILNNTKETVSEEAKNIVFKGGISPRGTLIMSFKLTIGKLAILDMDAFHNEAIISIYPNHDESDTIRDYLFYIINGLDLLRDTKAAIKGATLNKTSLNEILVPLPPLSEQKRIVAKIEEIFAVIDQIGTKKEEALSIIQNMRQTALQDAIMGVLVEQSETEEPASVLSEKIKKEKEQLVKEKKVKKEKPLPEIEESEVPLELPIKWEWIRLGDATNFIDYRGKTPQKTDSGIRLLTAKNVKKGYVSLYPEEFIREDDYEGWMTRGIPNSGDVLFTTEAPLGNVSTVNLDEKFALAQRLICLQPYHGLNSKFLSYALQGGKVRDYIFDKATGTTVTGIKAKELKKVPLPLPPLAEQLRIVDKLDEIMEICDQMEAILNGSSEMVPERIN